jgi:hypothetical protein
VQRAVKLRRRRAQVPRPLGAHISLDAPPRALCRPPGSRSRRSSRGRPTRWEASGATIGWHAPIQRSVSNFHLSVLPGATAEGAVEAPAKTVPSSRRRAERSIPPALKTHRLRRRVGVEPGHAEADRRSCRSRRRAFLRHPVQVVVAPGRHARRAPVAPRATRACGAECRHRFPGAPEGGVPPGQPLVSSRRAARRAEGAQGRRPGRRGRQGAVGFRDGRGPPRRRARRGRSPAGRAGACGTRMRSDRRRVTPRCRPWRREDPLPAVKVSGRGSPLEALPPRGGPGVRQTRSCRLARRGRRPEVDRAARPRCARGGERTGSRSSRRTPAAAVSRRSGRRSGDFRRPD